MQKGLARAFARGTRADTAERGTEEYIEIKGLVIPRVAGANSNNRARLGERHRTVVTRSNPKYCYPPGAFTSFGITRFLAVRRGALFMENHRKLRTSSARSIRRFAAGFKYLTESPPRVQFAIYRKVYETAKFFWRNSYFSYIISKKKPIISQRNVLYSNL